VRDSVHRFSPGNFVPTQIEPTPPKRLQAHCLWALLIARLAASSRLRKFSIT
jgi:hypothetical protein